MKTTKSICLTLLMLTGLLAGARGQNYRTDINPALLYYQSFLLAPKGEQWDRESQYLVTNHWEGQKLPEQFGLMVSNYDVELELARQAAHQTVPCDWGIDLSRGADTLLPQLAHAKSLVVDSEYRIRWDLQNGNQVEARDDLLADLALGRNISRNRTLISTLVEMAIENVACETIAENFNHFSSETLQQLADGFNDAPPRGTVAECTVSEKPIRDWYLAKIENIQKQYPNDNAGAMEALHRLHFDYRADEWERMTNGSGGTIGGVAEVVRNVEPLYAKLNQLMALPYQEYNRQLPPLKSEFEESGNPYFLNELPAWQSCRTREFGIEVDLAMVRAAIQYKLRGEAGLESVMDPCGNGPFTVQRFLFNGVDRGFELQSPFSRNNKGPESYIFVEKDGPAFRVMGGAVGQPISN